MEGAIHSNMEKKKEVSGHGIIKCKTHAVVRMN
jgi:hypothetical protein